MIFPLLRLWLILPAPMQVMQAAILWCNFKGKGLVSFQGTPPHQVPRPPQGHSTPTCQQPLAQGSNGRMQRASDSRGLPVSKYFESAWGRGTRWVK